MDWEHQAGLSQFASDRQATLRANVLKSLLQIHLAAAPDGAWHSLSLNCRNDAVTIPARPDVLRANEHVVLVIAVLDFRLWLR
jgi:hypothetical protein